MTGRRKSLAIPLTDAEWALVAPIFTVEEKQVTGRRRRNPRQILDAILWIELNNESWKRLPLSFPPMQTCYGRYLQWKRDGKLQRCFELLGICRCGEDGTTS
ncbi:transposase [Burkholderia sp. Ac-20365]|nr:transposase [Burkholderia sp. Ac-20365]